jgi:hypothetical protein
MSRATGCFRQRVAGFEDWSAQVCKSAYFLFFVAWGTGGRDSREIWWLEIGREARVRNKGRVERNQERRAEAPEERVKVPRRAPVEGQEKEKGGLSRRGISEGRKGVKNRREVKTPRR